MKVSGTISLRRTSIGVGVLYQLTCAASIIGGSLLMGALPSAAGGGYPPEAVAGAFLWFVNDLGIVLIAALLYPFLRKRSEGLALGLFGIRLVECLVLVAGTIFRLAAIKAVPGEATMLTGMAVLCETPLTLLFLGIGGIIFSILLLKSRMVPAFLAVFGVVAYSILPVVAALNLAGALTIEFGGAGMVPMLLVMALEMLILPIYLYVRGFSPPVPAAAEDERPA